MLVIYSISPSGQGPKAAQQRPQQAQIACPGTAVLGLPQGVQLSGVPRCTVLRLQAFSIPLLARKREMPQNETFRGEEM